jgi:molybdopterin synthase catalytic subunit
MIKVTDKPISTEQVVAEAKTTDSGCVATYVGLIRDNSHGKPVLSVEYTDPTGQAVAGLEKIADEIKKKFPVNNVAIWHRIGKLEVGDINLVVAIAAAHRGEGFDACRYAIDRFKESLPTQKKETYLDGATRENSRE